MSERRFDYTFYEIICKTNNDLSYIGSTKDLRVRMNNHKHNCNNENAKKYNYKIYRTIRNNGGWDNFDMKIITTQNNITKREAEVMEEILRIEFRADMNGKRCYRTEEQKKDYEKDYYEENKTKNLEYQKEYREENKAKIAEQNKEYYEENKAKINEKFVCECGGKYTHAHKAQHIKSLKHKNFIISKNK